MFESSQSTFFTIGCIASIALVLLLFPQLLYRRQHFHPRKVITAFEQKMFIRLKEAFPQHHVLAQVAFSALITSHQYKFRNKFNRKVTDFVILDESLEVLAIIELDDPTHAGRESEDAARDAMLHEAGYRVFRYTEIPSVRLLRKDMNL